MRTALASLSGLCLLLLAAPAAFGLDDEQRSALVEHFGKVKDLQDFSATAVAAALNDDEFKSFFDGYGKAITVVQVADKLSGAKDKEALQLLGGEVAKASLESMAGKVPALAGAVGAVNFVSWANTGLSLFKDFVFDPALQQEQLEHYVKLRGALEPADAAAKVPGWGYVREKALKDLEKSGFDMSLLWDGGQKGKLSKAWEARLEHFVTASFEARYAKKLVADAAAAAKQDLPGLDARAKKALDKHKNDAGGEGAFVADVPLIQGKKLEFLVNGRPVSQGKGGLALGQDDKLEIRVQAVGARRQQSRDLAKKAPANVTLEGAPTDWAFAYRAGKNASSWTVADETYDWKVQAKFGKATHALSGSRPNVKNDKLVLTFAPDTANETVTLDVSGTVKWEMTGTRANGQAAKDSAEESETGAIVIHVVPRK